MDLPKKAVPYHPLKSLKYAIEGLRIAFTRETNLSIQVVLGVTFCILGVLNDHAILAMANLILMGIVISLEMVNTAIETLCDLIHPGYNIKVKIIKDMAAGAVLMVALIWGIVIAYELLVIFILPDVEINF